MSDRDRRLVVVGCIVLGILALVLTYIFAPDDGGKRKETPEQAAPTTAPKSAR